MEQKQNAGQNVAQKLPKRSIVNEGNQASILPMMYKQNYAPNNCNDQCQC